MALVKQLWLGGAIVQNTNDVLIQPVWSCINATSSQGTRCVSGITRYGGGRCKKSNRGSGNPKSSNNSASSYEASGSEQAQHNEGLIWDSPRYGSNDCPKNSSQLTTEDSRFAPTKDTEQAQEKSRFSFQGLPCDTASITSRSTLHNGLSDRPHEIRSKDPDDGRSSPIDTDNTQWKNVFPAYMQSKHEGSDGENDEIVQVALVDGNGQPTGRVSGIAAAKAAAAATASAKALESHVNALNLSSTPALATPPCSSARPPTEGGKNLTDLISHDPIWAAVRAEARLEAEREPLLSSFLYASILAHSCFERSLGFVLANRLTSATLLATQLMDVFDDVFVNDPFIRQAIRLDVQAVKDRDPSCRSYSSALLYLKGYHALQSYRVAHVLWNRGQHVLALALQSRISEVFAVDIHPAARIGKAILLDHGTGIVIGETAVVGDRVSMLQGVTLGGTGKVSGDRHPKIEEGVLIGAGASILGNIVVGRGAMVAAGSLVLKNVPAHSMVAGTPAKVVGFLEESTPSLTMKHDFCNHLEEAVRRQAGMREDQLWGGAGI